MNKSARIGMRVAPEEKQQWEEIAAAWGYNGLSSFITAMINWAIVCDKYGGDYEKFMEESKNNV